MKDFQPLVSVIINCFNGEKYLREAIDSVINQTYTNWELVFWDNQSTDSTAEIVKSYQDPRIHYIYAQKHTPLGEARNLAVEHVNGEYLNFLDADDIWKPNKLREQVKLIVPREVEVVYTSFKVKFEGDMDNNLSMKRYYARLHNFRPNPKRTFYQNLLLKNWIIFSSVMFKTDLFREVGGINPSFKQNEDYEILLKCALRTEVACVAEEMVLYRIHASNNSIANSYIFIEENRKIYAELPDSPDLEKAKKELEVRHCFNLIREKKYGEAMKHYLRHGGIGVVCGLLCRRFQNC